MKQCTKRMLAWVLAAALLISCGISGLVLPAAAEAEEPKFSENFEGTEVSEVLKNWTAKGEVVDDPLNAGNKALKLSEKMATVYSGAGGAWGFEPNKTYLFSFKAYGDSGVAVRFNTSKGFAASTHGKTVNTTAGWTTINYWVQTTAKFSDSLKDAYCVALITAGSAAYIDDVTVTEVDNGGNLLYGGDFEMDGYYEHSVWANLVTMGGIVTDPADSSNKVLQFNVAATNKYFYNAIGLQPNTTYTLSLKAKGSNLKFYFNGNSKGLLTHGWQTILDSTGSEEWKDYSITFTTKASVDDQGSIIAMGSNSGTMNAYIDDVTLVQAPAESIALSQDALYLAQGLTEPMELIVEPIGGKMDSLTWTSGDETIATVDADGIVTAATDKTGEVTITATGVINGTTLTASRVITVVGDADTFELAGESMYLAPGTKQTAVVNATPKGAKVGTLTWSTSDEAVATVDENGVVTAVAAGTATITVKTADDNEIFDTEITDSLTVTVAEDGERVTGGDFETDTAAVVTGGVGTVATDSADRTNQVLQLGGNTALTLGGITLNGSQSYALTFKARGADVTTTISGAVAGDKGDVKTTLSATAWTTVTRTFTTAADATAASIALASTAAVELDDISLVQLPEATGITMTPGSTLELIPDATSQVGVTAQPTGAFEGDVTYSSTNPNVVTVDAATGKLTVVADTGSAIIIATSKNAKGETMTAAATVTVNEYANVLTNGDFEQGALNWNSDKTSKGASVESLLVKGAGVDGSTGLVLANDLGERITVYYKANVPLLPGTTYEVSYDYKSTDKNALRIWTGTLGYGQVYAHTVTGEWEKASKVFTTSANLKFNPGFDIAICIEDQGTADMVIDNLQIKMYYSGVDAESIEMTRKSIRLVPGRSTGLEVAATPINGDTNGLIWTSSNENVATVEYGVVTGVGKGTATITATTRNGKSASATVTVSGGEVLVGNGTFDVEGDNSWTVEGTAAIADGVGVKETAGGQISKAAEGETAGKLSQTVTGLKSDTAYTLSVRYAGTGNAGILLTDGTTKLVEASEKAAATYTTMTYEFKTPAELGETATLALTLAEGDGPVTFDYILLSENATLIDMVVNDIFWTDADGLPLEQDHQTTPGTELKFYVTVLNQGEDPITAGMTFDVDVQVDGETVQTISHTVEEDIASGAIVTAEGTETWVATKGDHTISACVNSTLSILELDDSNNDYFYGNLHVDDELIEIPEIAQQAGYDELIFNDEFESLHTVDTLGTGAAGYKWYITRPYQNTKLDPDDYEIKDGVLTMKNKDSLYNYGMATIDENTGRGFLFNKGYLEFRMRISQNLDEEHGGQAVWSFPADKIMETGGGTYAKQWVEMDWMEYWGLSNTKFPDGHYTITLHETIRGYEDDGITVDAENIVAKHSTDDRSRNGMADGEWHVLSFLWTDDLLIGYLDGTEVYRLTYGEGKFPDPLTTNTATEDGTGAWAYMNEQYLALILGGSVDNQLQLDYIRVWGGTGAGYVPPATDEGGDGEGEGTVVFDMAADIFWNNYCTDDWGDPIMPDTLDEYSVEYVLLGEADWVRLSAERQAEINALLKEKGQPTFEELLAAAKAFGSGTAGEPEEIPGTGERASALPALMIVVMIACAVALWATRKRRANG